MSSPYPSTVTLTVAGCGGFFAGKDQYQSNFVITSEKEGKKPKHLLFDCGTDAKFSLGELGLFPKDIDAVYVSHQHGDHMGGLEWLGFSTYFSGRKMPKPKLVCEQSLMVDLWEQSLKGSMSTLQGKVATLSEFFECHSVSKGGWFLWENIFFEMVQTIHVLSGFSIKHSYGLRFWPASVDPKAGTATLRRHRGGDMLVGDPGDEFPMVKEYSNCFPKPPIVFITGDCRFNSPGLYQAYNQSDIILHDSEMGAGRSEVHPHYLELYSLPPQQREKMYLYHCRPSDNEGSIKDGFKGILKKGQKLELW